MHDRDTTEYAKELLAKPNAFDKCLSLMVAGVCATASFDRNGVKLAPAGAEFQLPLPLLLEHNWNYPLGSVLRIKRTAACLWFEARLVNASWNWVADPWEQIKSGDLLGVSLAPVNLAGNYDRWAAREISICTEGVNPAATIRRVWERYKPDFHRFDREPGEQADITVHRDVGDVVNFSEAKAPYYWR